MASQTETQRVAAAIRDEITSGRWAPDTQLPRAADLAPSYGCGKHVVYEALRVLEAEGLVDMRRRGGTFVRRQDSPAVVVRNRSVLSDADGYYFDTAAKYWTSTRPTERSWQVPAADIAALLGTGDAPVLRRYRPVGPKGAQRPEQLAISHIHPGIAAELNLDVDRTGPGGIYARMEDAGYRLDWTEQVSARLPLPEEAADLKCPQRAPLLRVLRVTSARRDSARQVASVDEILQRADRYAYAYRLRR